MFRRCIAVSLSFSTLASLLVAQSTSLTPQRRFAIFFGGALESGEQRLDVGGRVGATWTIRSRSTSAIRLAASYQMFRFKSQESPPCGGGVPCQTFTGDALQLLQIGLAAAALVPSNSIAVIFGAGVYDALESPHDGQYAAAGWSIGLDAPIASHGFFQLEWHGIIGPGETIGFLTAGIGARF